MVRRPARRGANTFVCSLLNMGRPRYGDCIVVQSGGKTILIDGGHPSDDVDHPDRRSMPNQLKTILGRDPPFHFDLLIVTHCHQDHIGCLPKLIASDTVTCDRALVADENLGFGIDAEGEGDARLADADARVRTLVAALTEEDHSNLSDAELNEFIDAAARLPEKYKTMLDKLEGNADVVRYRQGTQAERDQVAQIVAAMNGTGMQIIGPTADQLVHCAETLQRLSGDAADMLSDMMMDRSESLADAYRRFMSAPADDGADFSHEPGWAKNCQSIVLTFGDDGAKALLPGDMQFAAPGLPDIEGFVRQLRRDVAAAGPYVFAKLPHHSSDNGISEEILTEWGWPPLLGHSGGFNDPGHPRPGILDMLKRLRRQHAFDYARTDRNGLITVKPAQRQMSGEEMPLNDFSVNERADEPEEGEQPQPGRVIEIQSGGTVVREASSGHFVDITFVRIPYLDGRVSIDGRVIEISGVGRGVQPEPGPPPPQPDKPQPRPLGNVLAAGRKLPPLLFVTDLERLRQNVGQDADRALDIIRRAGHRIVIGHGPSLAEMTRLAILESAPKGVVLLGGYDVVPSQRVDVLGDLRATIPASLVRHDHDGFVVWSDDVYGDREPDGVPELPVSRIPDARLGSFFLSMLTSAGTGQAGKFAIRNRERPFALAIYNAMAGEGTLQISAPAGIAGAQKQLAARENVYFMLHGDYRNTSTFWGEDDGGNFAAIDLTSLPSSGIGTAFAGCCWGALTVSEPAYLSGSHPTPRMVERSMALSILKGGAKAFVGCTGVHYSPGADGSFFGGPLHAAFWAGVKRGEPPALALFNARNDYVVGIPHGGRTALWNRAVERKIYKQFTCLGLGW